MMEIGVDSDFRPRMTKKSPPLLKEKRLAEKKLREKEVRVFVFLNVNIFYGET